MVNSAYNKTTIAERSGLTPRQVQFYTEQGIIVPEVDPGEGRGKTRLYSDHNLFQFGIVKVLVDLGLQVLHVKRIVEQVDPLMSKAYVSISDSSISISDSMPLGHFLFIDFKAIERKISGVENG